MVTTRSSRPTGAPRRSLQTIFDVAGALHAVTPPTPLIGAAPAANSAPAAFLASCKQLRKELFDSTVAKYVLRKVVNDKDGKFSGSEPRPGDLWARIITELHLAFLNEDPGFAPLFDLADATVPVRTEANSLLYSALANIVDPNSAAGDWLDASGAHFPEDGKRALLEVVRRLHDGGQPMAATRRLLAISFRPYEDPSPQIAEFNAELRESSRKTRWDDAEVKDLFLAALDKDYYLPVLNEYIGHEARAAVDLLTIQQRAMAVFAAKGKVASSSLSAGYAGGDTALQDQMGSVLEALESVRKELRLLKSGHGFTPRGDKKARDSPPPADEPPPADAATSAQFTHSARTGNRYAVSPLKPGNYNQSKYTAFDQQQKKFLPKCRHPTCQKTHARHYHRNCPHQAGAHAFHVEHADAISDMYQHAYDTRDAAGFHALCLLHGEPPVEEASAYSFTVDSDEIFTAYDDASHGTVSVGSFSTKASAPLHEATSFHNGLASFPNGGGTFMDRFCGAPLAAAAFTPQDTTPADTAPPALHVADTAFLSALEQGGNSEIHPDSGSQSGEPPAPVLDADGDPVSRPLRPPSVTFGCCRMGAFPRTALLTTAVLCTILASASAAHAAAAASADWCTGMSTCGVAPDTLPHCPSTAVGGAGNIFHSPILYWQFACAPPDPALGLVVYHYGIPDSYFTAWPPSTVPVVLPPAWVVHFVWDCLLSPSPLLWPGSSGFWFLHTFLVFFWYLVLDWFLGTWTGMPFFDNNNYLVLDLGPGLPGELSLLADRPDSG
ncbi:hypothetical protein CYMTET_32366 [Cymbomonas tetramitiformis]|uniref:Uncharacterized protein n=1 Tax=Cymbomonas tetramitiformis TaxID=36881 RepID=A0AAE0FFK0_9CHLO|nr:hypothetical protein CYMTET_32366 [Cymbomonas tetramitiformis]